MRLGGLLLALAACSGGTDTPTDPCTAPEAPTWSNFAQGHVQTWCTPCHTRSLTGEAARQGAPAGVDFDTYSDVITHATAVRVWATGDVPAMPPLGGVDARDVSRFDQWLECGAPGEDAPAGPCDERVRGDAATIATQADADALCSSGVNVVEGLTVTGSATLPCLCAVDGPVVVQEGTVVLPELVEITGTLLVTGDAKRLEAPQLVEIVGATTLEGHVLDGVELPRLDRVGGHLTVRNTWALVYLRLDGLQRAGAVSLSELPALRQVALPRLREVFGFFEVLDAPALQELAETNAVVRIDGDLRIERTGLRQLDHWAFQFLETLGGSLRIVDNPELASVEGFTLLPEAPGDLVVADDPLLRGVTGFDNLRRVGGDLVLARNEGMEQLTGFVNLTAVDGTLTLDDLPELRSANPLVGLSELVEVGGLGVLRLPVSRFDALPALHTVSGDLRFEDNDDLDDIDGFDALETLVGTLSVVMHPTLDGLGGLSELTALGGLQLQDNLVLDDLSALAQIVAITGDAEVRDNGGLTTLAPLHGVGSVGGAVTVTGNDRLSDAAASAWIDAIGPENIGGTVTVKDNRP
ncbi:MAG: hypothetical protein KTR31_19580 [Myxococcales bacterium]|nr:hypothetical protein [Myxococcales bacterium]